MIAAAITRVARELNQALKRNAQSTEDLVVVSNLLEADGTVVPQSVDKLVAFLVNIEREPSPRRTPDHIPGAGRTAVVQPPIFLNLMVMFVANFSGAKYPEALKAISGAAAFFQGQPVFDHQNTPDLDPGIERLSLEIENLSIADLGNMWGVLGGRYLPSLLYRMRMVVIDSSRIEAQAPQVVRPVVNVLPEGVG
ncbi:DUF4255 domain-containing protein [Phenylobacterium sp.]|uniref:DUF4255 domain-containing protein n=1 Tax=Phenylobacterium sp. TaxID=1871053 RepID=UPI0025EEDD93|nr:DUF4255 domain-containing protein [Phenylobacterium sp.]